MCPEACLPGTFSRSRSDEEEYSANFTPAAPFVTGLVGIAAVAQTARLLSGDLPTSLHFQFSFTCYCSSDWAERRHRL